MSSPETTVPARAKLVRLIHVGKSKLGLDRAAYEALLEGATGKRSSADMTEAELRAALDGMKAAGFRGTFDRGEKLPVHPSDAPLCSDRQLYYIKGLWALASRRKTEESLQGFVKRIAGVDSLRFLDRHAASQVIQALRDIARKAGYDPDGPVWRERA